MPDPHVLKPDLAAYQRPTLAQLVEPGVQRGIARMQEAGLKPVAFPDCRGHDAGSAVSPRTHFECYRCSRYSCGKGGHEFWREELSGDLGQICANYQPVLAPGAVAAMDETAGITHPQTIGDAQKKCAP